MKYDIAFLLHVILVGFFPFTSMAQCEFPEKIEISRPNPEQGPTPVTVGIFLNQIKKIDDINQTFTADFFIEFKWQDTRLSEKFGEGFQESCRIDVARIWSPRPVIGNQDKLDPQYGDIAVVNAEGEISYIQRYHGTLVSDYLLKRFPFDSHDLIFSILTLSDAEEVQFLPNQKSGRNPQISLEEWSLGEGGINLDQVSIELTGKNIPRFQYIIPLTRNFGFYLWRVALPIFMILVMSWLSFFIPPSYRVVQIGLASTAFLTMMVFGIKVGDFIPRVSYLTVIGKFSFTCILLSFLALAETVVTGILAGEGREGLAKTVDRWSRWLYFIVFAILLGIIYNF